MIQPEHFRILVRKNSSKKKIKRKNSNNTKTIE